MAGETGGARYEIELDGRASDRVLRPVIDEFAVDLTEAGTTRLLGEVRDSSHLHGLLVHFTSLNVDVISLRRVDEAPGAAPQTMPTTTDPRSEEP